MMLQVSSSPHIRDQATTRRLMLDVIIALCPALLASFWLFGLRAILVTLLAVVSAVAFEYLSRLVMKRTQTIGDLSAVVTGLLLAFNLPPTVPYWLPVIGSAVAVIVVKQMFGGIGQNFVNPALASRIILVLSFPAAMTAFAVQSAPVSVTSPMVDLIAKATPLSTEAVGALPSYLDLLLGFGKGGCLGEVSILALLIGAIYLVVRKVIKLWIPLVYIATVAIIAALGRSGSSLPCSFRRFDHRCFLHGHRLCNLTADSQGQGHLRARLRPADRDHPPFRRNGRGSLLFHRSDEYHGPAH